MASGAVEVKMNRVDPMGTPFLDYLSRIEDVILDMNLPPVAPAARQALRPAGRVSPQNGYGLDWLVAEAVPRSKPVYLRSDADFMGFVFIDRSVLVFLQSGNLYAVPSAGEINLRKIDDWFHSHGIQLATVGQPSLAS